MISAKNVTRTDNLVAPEVAGVCVRLFLIALLCGACSDKASKAPAAAPPADTTGAAAPGTGDETHAGAEATAKDAHNAKHAQDTEPPRELAFPVVDAELLYAAKIKPPKRPRRRPRRKTTKSAKKKSAPPSMARGSSAGSSGKDYGRSLGAPSSSAPAREPAVRGYARPDRPKAGNKSRGKGKRKGNNTRYLSADDSNSQASPVLVRQAIAAGRYVHHSLVRPYEFLNYHTFDYEPPARADDLSISAHMRRTSKPDEFSMQVAIRSGDRALAAVSPLHITFLLDTSGSMAGPSSELASAFVERFVAKLRKGDRVSLVVANRKAKVLMEHHEVVSAPAAVEAVQAKLRSPEAQPNDVTNLERGIKAAYELAVKYSGNPDGKGPRKDKTPGLDQGAVDASAPPKPQVKSRVVLISDGATNFGRLSKRLIARHARDADQEGIYLAGVGLGAGFNDQLMNTFTDRGRGAYLFIDSEDEIARVLEERSFVANFDVSLKDVRLKMVMPEGWSVKSFAGEQISKVKSKVTPQYLAPNDQMIYHMILATENDPQSIGADSFSFEAEYTPIGAEKKTKPFVRKVAEMLGQERNILKGNALVMFAETLKKMKFPLDKNRDANLKLFDRTMHFVEDTHRYLDDAELAQILKQMRRYRSTLERGESFPDARDREDTAPDAVLGLLPAHVGSVKIRGSKPKKAIRGLTRLRHARKLVPQEGYRFLAISTGPVGNSRPADSGELSQRQWRDPRPRYYGKRRAREYREPVYDLYQVTLELTAPDFARSFSFDFNYFSAEYPEFIQQEYNDTFYAILKAPSTNDGKGTNISFDANNHTIEVDNNYFQNQFHPIPNWGTGFDYHGSTGWLRTSWPIQPGEAFTLTFSVHDEGDAIFDSMVLLDNFQFHPYPAVGTTDPLN